MVDLSQSINYKINVDDSGFQAKLSQLRASMDMTIGGGGMGMGMGGMSMGAMGAMMAPMGSYGNMGGANMYQGGVADFGSQIRPVTYTPPAIAMQPHFGMISMTQGTGQMAAGSLGFPGMGAYAAGGIIGGAAAGGLVGGVFGGLPGAVGGALFGGIMGGMGSNFTRDIIPSSITAAEYMQLSSRNFGTRAGDAVASAALVGGGTAASLAGGALGGLIGSLGGPIGSFAGSMIGSTLASGVQTGVGEMMADNRSIQTQLEAGSFRFITGGADLDPLTGKGFGRRARNKIADEIQTMELHDVRYGMGDMKQILEGGMQMDLFSGTSDVQGFKDKFKGLVENLKTITSVLHTTTKEGLETIRGFRDMGVTDPGEINRLALRSETLGRASGKTGMEMMAIGQAGAEMFRGTGVSMELGFNLNQMNTANIRGALNQGTLTRETIAQAGGEASLAQQMTANALGFTQTAFGRGVLMAATRGGAAVDPLKIARGDAQSLLAPAAGMSAGEMIHFEAHQEEIISKMTPMQLQMTQIGGAMAQARTIAGAGMDIGFEDAFISMQLRQGTPRHVIEAQMATLRMDPKEYERQQQTQIRNMGVQQAEEDIRNSLGVKAISNKWRETLYQPAQRYLSGLSASIGTKVADMTNRILGGAGTNLTGVSEESVKRGKTLLTEQEASGTGGGQVRDVSMQLTQHVTDWLGLEGQHGGRLADLMLEQGKREVLSEGPDKGREAVSYEGGQALLFSSYADIQQYAASRHVDMNILERGTKMKSGKLGFLAISDKEVKVMNETRKAEEPTDADHKAAKGFKVSPVVSDKLEELAEREAAGGRSASLDEIKGVLGKGFAGLSKGAQTDVLESNLHQWGLYSAEDRLKGKRGTATVKAAQAISKAEYDASRGLQEKLDSDVGIGTMTAAQRGIVARLAGEKEGSAGYRTLFKELRGTDLDKEGLHKVHDFLASRSETQRKEISDRASQYDIDNAKGAAMQKSYQGTETLVGKSLGDLSKTTTEQMISMGEALKNQMKDLMKMHAEFEAAIKKGSARRLNE